MLSNITGIFENILGFNSDLSPKLVSNTKILSWLLTRIETPKHDENCGYAAEILSILLQDNRDNRLALGKKDGVETLLKVLSVRPSQCASFYFVKSSVAFPQKGSCQC